MLAVEKKTEYINGREIMMAPAGTWHNSIGGNLYSIIHRYLRKKRCKLFYETKVVFDEQNRFIPDLMIVCDRSKIKPTHIEGAPDLIVEILSPATRKNDVGVKMDVYEKFGVKEYWIVSPKEETIDVYLQKDGRLKLDNSYHNYTEEEWDALEEEEKAEATLVLKVSLYNDLEIDVREVFER